MLHVVPEYRSSHSVTYVNTVKTGRCTRHCSSSVIDSILETSLLSFKPLARFVLIITPDSYLIGERALPTAPAEWSRRLF